MQQIPQILHGADPGLPDGQGFADYPDLTLESVGGLNIFRTVEDRPGQSDQFDRDGNGGSGEGIRRNMLKKGGKAQNIKNTAMHQT